MRVGYGEGMVIRVVWVRVPFGSGLGLGLEGRGRLGSGYC